MLDWSKSAIMIFFFGKNMKHHYLKKWMKLRKKGGIIGIGHDFNFKGERKKKKKKGIVLCVCVF